MVGCVLCGCDDVYPVPYQVPTITWVRQSFTYGFMVPVWFDGIELRQSVNAFLYPQMLNRSSALRLCSLGGSFGDYLISLPK